MKVDLMDYAGDDIRIVNVAKVSFDKEVDSFGDKEERLLNYLAKHKHSSPFRHTFIQLRCSVPLFLARQLMKHQAGLSWNEVSRRYVDTLPEIYYPDFWSTRPEGSIKQGAGSIHNDNDKLNEVYGKLMATALEEYSKLLEQGVAPEQARMILPQSMMVDFIWSGNLLAFAHVFNLRCGAGAQYEARRFAWLLDNVIAPLFPVGWEVLTNE